MMLLTIDGCYLIDRSFKFRRVQMRFPCKHSREVSNFLSLLTGLWCPYLKLVNLTYLVLGGREFLIKCITTLCLMERWS